MTSGIFKTVFSLDSAFVVEIIVGIFDCFKTLAEATVAIGCVLDFELLESQNANCKYPFTLKFEKY